MAAENDPLSSKRKKRAPIGFLITYPVCLDCWSRLPEESKPWIERASEDLLEGDDGSVPYECHKCGAKLRP